MSKILQCFVVLALMACLQQSVNADNFLDTLFGKPALQAEWTYRTGIFDDSAAEICAFDKTTGRVFVTNSAAQAVNVLDAADGAQIDSIDVSDFGSPTSVAAYEGLIAIAVPADEKDVRGTVLFVDAASLTTKSTVEVGYLPDMLTFTPDGKTVVVANEGEPKSDYSVDPEGSVSVIKVNNGNNPSVKEAKFTSFNGQKDVLIAKGVRIFGPNATVAQDVEPEYVAIDKDSGTAYVSLQENNAIAVIDLKKAKVLSIDPLGFKDHSQAGVALDASDKDNAINIRNWPAFGMYQPDGIATINFLGFTLVVSANEGDARDYDAFAEEVRVKDVTLSLDAFPDRAELRKDKNLGRLTITSTLGENEDREYEKLYAFGARSFSIWLVSSRGFPTQVYDSGEEFEQITADQLPADFNSNNDENETFDNRSDNKGPEPEGIAVGKDLLQTFSFIGMERIGGIMTYDITNPFSPRFMEYNNNRDFSGNPEADTAGDLGPEGIAFVPRSDSPFVEPVLIVANEVSGSTTMYRIKRVGGILSHLFNE